MKHLGKLISQIEEMQQYVADLEEKNAAVSRANVGWHLSHAAKVIEKVNIQLRDSQPTQYAPRLNFKRVLVLWTGHIPRGKARSPSTVLPEENFTFEELQTQINDLRKVSEELKNLPEGAFFDHPYFDHLKKNVSIKFLTIHTEHHLKIVRDILK